MKKRLKPNTNKLVLVCFLLYVITMMAKTSIVAEIVQLVDVFKVESSKVSFSSTYYFIAYAIMQLVLFFIFSKLHIERYLTITLIFSAICTIIIGFNESLTVLYVISTINGVLQAGLWAGCNTLLGMYLTKKDYVKATKAMSIGLPVGYALAYAFSALFVYLNIWNVMFVFSGIALCIMTLVFYFVSKQFKDVVDNSDDEKTSSMQDTTLISLKTNKDKVLFYVILFLLAFMVPGVYYAIMNWIPSYLELNFNIEKSVAILLSVGCQLVIIIGPVTIMNLCNKHNNYVKINLYYMIIALIISFVLLYIFDVNFILSLITLSLLLIALNSVRSFISGSVMFKMKGQIDVTKLCLIINVVGSVSAGVIAPLFSFFFEKLSWTAYFIALFTSIVIMCFILFISLLLLRKKKI